jgi:acetolactate synthase-1/3 small subunit
VLDLNDGKYIERELMLVKVKATPAFKDEMKRMSDIFRGRIIDVADNSYTIELTGSSTKLDAFLDAIDKAAIIETVRTGASGIGRGDRTLKL